MFMKWVVHNKIDKFDVYIGRPSKWSNPYTYKKDKKTLARYIVETREEAIQKYIDWLLTQDALLASLKSELKGKVLGCWCAPKGGLGLEDKPYVCHGQVLAELANK